MLETQYPSSPRALAPAQEPVSPPCPSNVLLAKINRSNIPTLNFSLFSLNLPTTELPRSTTKLARASTAEGTSFPAVAPPPANSIVPQRRQQQTRTQAAASWSPKIPPTAVSPAVCSLAASRRVDCCSTGCGCPFQALSSSDSHARQLNCVRKKQFSPVTIQNIKCSPDTCVRNLETLCSIDCSASPAVVSKSGVEVLTTRRESSVLELSKFLSTLVLRSHKRLSNRESNCDNTQLSKIPTKTQRPDLQAVRPDKFSVSGSAFFGYTSETSSRSPSPEPGAKAHHELDKVTSAANSGSPSQAAVASAPPEGGRDGGSRGPWPQQYCQGDVVLISFLCPERPDIAADTVTLGLSRTRSHDEEDDEMLISMDIDKAYDEKAMDKEEGGTNGSQEREGSGSGETNGTDSNERSEQSSAAGGQSGSPASAGGGSQNGSGGGSDGNDEEKKPPTNVSHEMDIDGIVEEVRVKEEQKEEEKEHKTEMSQDEKDRLSSIAKLAAERTPNGEAMDILPSSDAASGLIALHNSNSGTIPAHINPDSPNRHHAPPQPLSNGASHSPNPAALQPSSQADITMSTLPIISESAHQVSSSGTKPTLPSLSSALSIHQLADAALHSQGYSNTSQPGHFSPPQAVVSIAGSQRSSDTPQPVSVSPPALNQAQAGYGPEGAHARKPMHHMTVQERAPYVHALSTSSTYYTSMQYQYTPMNEEMHTTGPPSGMQGSLYPPPPPHVYAPGRELPGLGYAPAPPYHYPHEASSTEPQPLRTGSAANMFAQPPFEEHTPSGPPTGETMISVAGSDDTIVAPQMPTLKRSSTSSRGDGTSMPGSFRCTHPGCTASAFQTQYLLNSHANVHSVNRPHFCQVPGCPRGEKGRGFKRKNEMIRHGLVHESPGYVCPFCPDRDHKYPRPDNLQRHVRVHHQDKSRDDPQLREVLAQRPEGGARGRRRRVGG